MTFERNELYYWIAGVVGVALLIGLTVYAFTRHTPAPEVAAPPPTFQCQPCKPVGIPVCPACPRGKDVSPAQPVPKPVPAPRVERKAAPAKAAPKPNVKIKKLDPSAPIDCGKVAALRAKVPADVILAAVDRRLTKAQAAQVRACMKR